MRSPIPVLAVGLVLIGSSARAQTQTSTHPSLDLTIGAATSWGGAHAYRDRAKESWSVTFVPDRRGSWIAAFTVGSRPAGASDLVCVIEAGGGCAPDFPGMTDLGILVGREARTANASLRVALGPMLYLGGFRAGGARLQLDAAGGFRHVQLVVGGRGDWVRRGGESVRLGAIEFGLRLQD